MEQDEVFKALADSNRRKLLDLLFQEDGRTLSELQVHLDMTRFGCMKHLQVLEEAGLITTRKVGREKHHYLNPVPIQQVYDRWVSKYAQPWTEALVSLKDNLEKQSMTPPPNHVFQIFIRTSPTQLWQALTDGEMTRQYYMGCRVQSDWAVGSVLEYTNPDGVKLIAGKVLEVEVLQKLVHTFRPLWVAGSQETTVTWEIEQVGATCKLTVTHADLVAASPLTEGLQAGWVQILSGLKTLLETGEPLVLGN